MIDFSASLPQATWLMMLGDGLLAFLSPCVLPMLPVYALYLLGMNSEGGEGRAAWGLVLRRCLGLEASFVLLFTLIGAGAGFLGNALQQTNRDVLNGICGGLMILFGLWTLGILRLPGIRVPGLGRQGKEGKPGPNGFWGAFAFGLLLALSWTPCMTPLLANALVLAASAENATMATGMAHLAIFALGLSLPMVAFILLYQWMKGAMAWLRKHGPAIRRVGGILMAAYGLYLMIAALV
jgi:cytochrome c-type biogenesis protein